MQRYLERVDEDEDRQSHLRRMQHVTTFQQNEIILIFSEFELKFILRY